MTNIRTIGGYTALAGFSIITIWLLFPKMHPFSGLDATMPKHAIEQRAMGIIAAQGVPLDGFMTETHLYMNRDILRQSQVMHGFAKTNILARGDIPVYYWDVRWIKRSSLNISLNESGNNETRAVRRNVEAILGEIQLRYDMRGNLLYYSTTVRDSTTAQHTPVDARSIAIAFIRRHNPALALPERPIGNDTLTDASGSIDASMDRPREYVFKWKTFNSPLQDTVNITASVFGGAVTSMSSEMVVPKTYLEDSSELVSAIVNAVAIIVLVVLLIVVGIKRYRAYELGYKSGLWIGVITAVCMAYELILQIPGSADYKVFAAILIPAPFVGLAMWLTWAISEAVGRETDPDRFVAYDLIMKGHILNRRTGFSMLRGLSIGMALCALTLTILLLLRYLLPISVPMIPEDSSRLSLYFSGTPFGLLAKNVYVTFFGITTLIIFLFSLFQQRSTRLWIAAVLTAGMFALVQGRSTAMAPAAAAWLPEFVAGLVLALVYARFGVVAALSAGLTQALALNGFAMFFTGSSTHAALGIVLLAFYACLLLAAIIAAARTDPVMDIQQIRPAFAQRITERQRLQRELEIARMVQMSFLPKKDPMIPGLEIASRCTPAYEVGGDYYDFIQVGPHKLAVAIGDVSGKGTQAAFYMTLTKGFLHALASQYESPAAVLTEMNKLFYKNVERGNFISMIYAVFDMERHTLSVARAGHNPLFRKKQDQDVDVILSKGLALGFESGEKFAATIEEVTQPLHPGDVFVFYTDGIPEAMSNIREEFGEERMMQSIQIYEGTTPQGYMDHLFKETERFTGKAEQHDDMTVVVVKVVAS